MNRLSVFIISVFVISSFFVGIPERVDAQPQGPLCCQVSPDTCFDSTGIVPLKCLEDDIYQSSLCDTEIGKCVASRNVPTLSQWGVLSMAGILGLAGFFMVIRRRKTAV